MLTHLTLHVRRHSLLCLRHQATGMAREYTQCNAVIQVLGVECGSCGACEAVLYLPPLPSPLQVQSKIQAEHANNGATPSAQGGRGDVINVAEPPSGGGKPGQWCSC